MSKFMVFMKTLNFVNIFQNMEETYQNFHIIKVHHIIYSNKNCLKNHNMLYFYETPKQRLGFPMKKENYSKSGSEKAQVKK